VGVSLQVAILKVLSGHPQGRASLTALNSDLQILVGCRDWNGRMRRLATRAPDLDIFSQRFVVRDSGGWQLTDAGRTALAAMETAEMPSAELLATARGVSPCDIVATAQSANVVDLDCVRRQRRVSILASRSA